MTKTVSKNLFVAFACSMLILVLSSVASLISINNLLSSSQWVSHTFIVKEQINDIEVVLLKAESSQRGFLLTGNNVFLKVYANSYDSAIALTNSLKILTNDTNDQLGNITFLEDNIRLRFQRMQQLINENGSGKVTIAPDEIEKGRLIMAGIREKLTAMIEVENNKLETRTAKLDKFSKITPIFIILAGLLSLLVSILFYLRIKKDLTEKDTLRKNLQDKDEEVTRKIILIERMAKQIADGDYTQRIQGGDEDELGRLAGSLNNMAVSLHTSFTKLEDKEWLKTGLAGLNRIMLGNENLKALSSNVINYLVEYTKSEIGAFYHVNDNFELVLMNGFALTRTASNEVIKMGEGIVGQVASQKKLLKIEKVTPEDIFIQYSSTGITPKGLIAFPILYENVIMGVIELGSIESYTDLDFDFLEQAAFNIGVTINSVENREKVQNLLEETQTQAEELMTQQTELEQINAELEAQSQHLQTSEEELKVQSEELMETNTILEERSKLLEERNSLIVVKNQEIEKRAKELAQSTKYKSEFLANMSHELRTPLNSILLLSRLIAENHEGNLSADQVQYAEVIQNSGNGLLQLIDEILDLSKIEAGKMNFEYLPVMVGDIVQDINNLFDPLGKEKKLDWKITVNADVPVQIETDKMRLEQVLKNLLSNAFKFTEEGKVHLHIYMQENPKGFICFKVTDSGIGIELEKQQLIFEAFQQEDGSTRRKYGGTGLGLSISRELAKLLGGEIILSSKPGEGSEFVICIPETHHKKTESNTISLSSLTEKTFPEDVDGVHNQNYEKYFTDVIPEEIEDDAASILPGDKIILIIEDDTAFAQALTDYARQKNYKVISTVQGDKGIELALQYNPSGILLDVQLPVKNGWQVMETLKSNPRTKHIPIHIMSSFEVKKESLMGGAIDFINKPVAFEKLNTIFDKLDYVLNKKEKKVLIIEENNKHAKALSYYLSSQNINTEISQNTKDSIGYLQKEEVDCVILDIGGKNVDSNLLMETIRQKEGLENLPVIIFTDKMISLPEEFELKKYADSIVLKTANSYKRVMDEVSIFLHLVQEQNGKTSLGFEKSVMQENVLKGKTVLLADDDVRNIYSLTRVLEKFKMKVIPAMDGKEAVKLLNEHPATDIVLMDIMMPEMDGLEAIRTIRKNGKTKFLPIIAVTAKAMSGDRESCIAAGASDYISKPIDTDQLIALLRIWLFEKNNN